MKIMLSILLTGILTENFILAKFLGICPFLGVSKKLNTAVGMSAAVIFVMLLATAVTYPINAKLLVPNDLEYLQTIVFILVIAALVQLVEIVLKKYIPSLYNALGIYLPLITTNCAVLGVVLINVENNYNFGQSMMRSLGGGLGFMLAMVMFAPTVAMFMVLLLIMILLMGMLAMVMSASALTVFIMQMFLIRFFFIPLLAYGRIFFILFHIRTLQIYFLPM